MEIKCPKCNGRMIVRTSEKPTPQTIEASVYCSNCGSVRAKFLGQLTDIQSAKWERAPELENSVYEKNKPATNEG